ncbi:hypothetical protein HDU93_003335 [Gonapodya sp. JEL0774]|nr:hypothetical protein HDU93_003335 [Gonapodya sp. JEL0774]
MLRTTAKGPNVERQSHALSTPSADKESETGMPNRQERRRRFGIDAPELVKFTRWEPGGEYIKQFTIKNVVMKLAHVLTGEAVCKFGDKTSWHTSKVAKRLKISGIGKFSHISIKEMSKDFDFGEVFVGKTSERKILLENKSPVGIFCRLNL